MARRETGRGEWGERWGTSSADCGGPLAAMSAYENSRLVSLILVMGSIEEDRQIRIELDWGRGWRMEDEDGERRKMESGRWLSVLAALSARSGCPIFQKRYDVTGANRQ